MSVIQQKSESRELKGQIQQKYGYLNKEEVESLNRRMDKLTRVVQKTYHFGPGKAEQAYNAFNKILEKNN